MGSELRGNVAQQLISNIFHVDGVNVLYNAGAYSFRNSSDVVTFSVSDAGALSLPVRNTHTFGVASATGGGTLLSALGGAASTTGFTFQSGTTANTLWYTMTNDSGPGGNNAYNIYNATGGYVASCSLAGDWTFPVSVKSGGFSTASGTLSTTSSPSSFYAIPGPGRYEVVFYYASADTSISATATVIATTASASRIIAATGGAATLSLNAMNIAGAHSVGGTLTCQWSVTKIG
jgi:hypothetical protein